MGSYRETRFDQPGFRVCTLYTMRHSLSKRVTVKTLKSPFTRCSQIFRIPFSGVYIRVKVGEITPHNFLPTHTKKIQRRFQGVLNPLKLHIKNFMCICAFFSRKMVHTFGLPKESKMVPNYFTTKGNFCSLHLILERPPNNLHSCSLVDLPIKTSN